MSDPGSAGRLVSMSLDWQQLTGRSRTHIVQLESPRIALHRDVVAPFLALRAAAAADGIDLIVSSSFRDFDAQCAIWNRKFRGERPLLDAAGDVIDPSGLDDGQRIDHILRWSALPGASRHHWGTEVDLYDAAAAPQGYRVQLVPAEFAAGGVFGRVAAWLAANAGLHGFYPPYCTFLGGVQPEPWHWSYAPISGQALATLTPAIIAEALADADLDGKSIVLERLDAIHRRYVLAVTPPPIVA